MDAKGDFKPKQQRLAELLRRSTDAAQTLQNTSVIASLNQQQERVKRYSFKVLFMGPFDAGKSTLINALLGAEVLPSYKTEATAIPCEIKYTDEEPYYMLYPLDDDDTQPVRASLEEAAEDLKINKGKSSRMSRAELFWPLDLCRDGVEIVDSPGLDATVHRDEVLVDYLHNADAIVFISLELGTLGLTVQNFLKRYVFSLVHADDTFCVINWVTDDYSDRELVLEGVKDRLAAITESGLPPRDDRIFIVNAKHALRGRLSGGGSDDFLSSGVPEFIEALQHFLIKDRGRVKLRAPIRVLRSSVATLRSEVDSQRRMYMQQLGELAGKYEAEKPNLQKLGAARASISAALNVRIQDMLSAASDEAHNALHNLAQQFSTWAELSKPTVKINQYTSGEDLQVFTREVTDSVNQACWEAELEWERGTWRPGLEARLKSIGEGVHEEVERFVVQVSDIRQAISGAETQGIDVQAAANRVLENTTDLQLYTGIDQVDVDIQPYQRSGLEKLLDWIWVPVVFDPITAAVTWISGQIGKQFIKNLNVERATSEGKRAVANGLREEFERTIPERVDKFKSQLDRSLHELYSSLDRRLAAEVETVRNQVESVIDSMRAGKREIDQRVAGLDDCYEELDSISRACRELSSEIENM